MLQSLQVKNFAIIDNINIEFNNGFTAITGETGAGKSLLIDAIGLLLGDKASASMIRTGEAKAIIEGVFTNLGKATTDVLENYGLLEDDLLIIRKEINNSGKSLVRVNGSVVTMNELSAISATLADIHTQNDTKKLFEPQNYLSFIDDQKTFDTLKTYQTLRSDYLKAVKELQDLISNLDNYKKEKDYLMYQYDTLVKADLKEGELEALEEEFNFMNHYELIFKNLSMIKNNFKDYNINDLIYEMNNSLEKISEFDPKYQKMGEIVKNAYYDLNDIESSISQELENLEFDRDHFEEVTNRLNFLKDLKYKYQKSVSELISYRDELSQKINLLDDDQFAIKTKQQTVDVLYEKVLTEGQKLTKLRKANALILEKNIKEALCDLMLDKVVLKIIFNNNFKDNKSANSFPKNGLDDVNIMISFNPGEALRDLSKVASGGEMSRVMLAIKTHLMANMELSTMIFDEIDSGVSGEVALEVAKKLKAISKYTQVLAITHLPIVAGMADQQLFITKKVIDNKTLTSVKELSYNERIEVLAKMISPTDQSGKSKDLAINMLNMK